MSADTAIHEHTHILVKRYRSPDGRPTCCADHPAGETCRFFGTRNFGTVDVCMFGQQRDLYRKGLEFVRPDAQCEVWT